MVEIRGVISPKKVLPGSVTVVKIFTLPQGYRPNKNRYLVCQGSSRNVWLLIIENSGEVFFSRYGTNLYTDASTTTWLPFNVAFLVD